jgi:hypothetical protein
MCLICADLEKGKLTRLEADNAFREMLLTDGEYGENSEHYLEAGIDNLEELAEESRKK